MNPQQLSTVQARIARLESEKSGLRAGLISKSDALAVLNSRLASRIGEAQKRARCALLTLESQRVVEANGASLQVTDAAERALDELFSESWVFLLFGDQLQELIGRRLSMAGTSYPDETIVVGRRWRIDDIDKELKSLKADEAELAAKLGAQK